MIVGRYPENPDFWRGLATMQLIAGKRNEAVQSLVRALAIRPDAVCKDLLTQALSGASFPRFMPEVKAAILACFGSTYDASLVRCFPGWLSLLKVDPVFAGFCKAMAADSDDAVAAWLDSLDAQSGACLSEPYLLQGLRLLTLADPALEVLLTRLRRYLCLNRGALTISGRMALFEPVLAALAEQCFFNEYVFLQTPEEETAIAALAEDLKKSGPASAPSVALLACYRPLFRSCTGWEDEARALATGRPGFASLLKTQLEDPLEEQRLKSTLPEFGAIANDVSKAVQEQYEENPYPRWISIAMHPSAMDGSPFAARRNDSLRILIAGCGTGYTALGAAASYPNARVIAIDLSRASLAYGTRKAKEAGVAGRIEFIHADILSLEEWKEPFDFIECFGVLHHMQDPFAGWKTLTEVLKVGGHMNIGLYSATARTLIVTAREYASQAGYQPTPEGIRAFRRDILARPVADAVRGRLVRSGDFYSTSMLRDLVFHVQEHRMTLPQIGDMMKRLNLEIQNMIINAPGALLAYKKMFRDDPQCRNLDHWDEFEKQNPGTFRGMYQFWCRKTA